MSRSLTLSDELYHSLETTAQARGLDSIETLIADLLQKDATLKQHQETVDRIQQLRDRIYEQCGEMPDSTPLIREDRDR